MDIPGIGRRRDVAYRLRATRIAHIDDAKAFREHVADERMAICHHDLHPIGPAALIGKSNQAHVARVIGARQFMGHR